ncbi:MAG TPA: hypothetical protein VH141_19745 [Pseudonocardia sp.]|jgi:hypothetical protein|nr:hypothetical protein [Pseudonocardia sp.]
MAELGQTGDPRALVPGAPEVIEADAAALTRHGQRAEQVGQGLRRVDVGNWAGAAGTGFADTWAKEPPRWLKVADSISTTSGAMTSYAGTLRWAQQEAGGAIALWNRAAEVTTRAYGQYQSAAVSAAAAGAAITPFADPGEQYRARAREQLDRARQQLREAGNQAAIAIAGRAVGTPGADLRSGGSLNHLVDAVTDGWKGQGTVTKNGPKAGAGVALAQGGKLAELKAYAQLGGATWAGGVRLGELTLSGKGGFDVGAQATALASVGRDGLVAKAEVSAAARASVEGHVDYGQLGLYGRATGSAGADASAGLKIGPKAVVAEAGASAGLKGKVAGGAELGGLAVGATAEGWLGVGAKAKFGFERTEDGKFHLGGSAGVAVGAGGAVGFEVTVDPEQVEQTARDAADALGAGAQAVGHAAEDVGRTVGDTVGAAADSVGHAVGDTVGAAADNVGHAVGDIGKFLNP